MAAARVCSQLPPRPAHVARCQASMCPTLPCGGRHGASSPLPACLTEQQLPRVAQDARRRRPLQAGERVRCTHLRFGVPPACPPARLPSMALWMAPWGAGRALMGSAMAGGTLTPGAPPAPAAVPTPRATPHAARAWKMNSRPRGLRTSDAMNTATRAAPTNRVRCRSNVAGRSPGSATSSSPSTSGTAASPASPAGSASLLRSVRSSMAIRWPPSRRRPPQTCRRAAPPAGDCAMRALGARRRCGRPCSRCCASFRARDFRVRMSREVARLQSSKTRAAISLRLRLLHGGEAPKLVLWSSRKACCVSTAVRFHCLLPEGWQQPRLRVGPFSRGVVQTLNLRAERPDVRNNDRICCTRCDRNCQASGESGRHAELGGGAAASS